MKIDPIGFVLDCLRHGPANLDDFYRDAWKQSAFSREQVQDALRRLGVKARKRPQDGAVFVMRPANVVAIWWHPKRSQARRFTGTATGGSAA
jgi:hypothetical protein